MAIVVFESLKGRIQEYDDSMTNMSEDECSSTLFDIFCDTCDAYACNEISTAEYENLIFWLHCRGL